jgi:hypothetical protein
VWIDWLHDLPPLVGASIVCATFLVPTLIGSRLLQPAVARLLKGERDANAAVGLLLNAFTLYYAVLLALLSVAVYENYGRAEEAIGREASSIVVLYRDLNGYPEPQRTSFGDALRRYVDEEAGPSWGEQQRGESSGRGTLLADDLGRQLMSFRPGQTGLDLLHRETLRTFDEFVDRRRARLQAARTSVPPVLWYVVVVGAALNVLVLWLFDLTRSTHFIIGGVLTVFIGLVIYMVAVLDQPFRGVHGLEPRDLLEVRQQINP